MTDTSITELVAEANSAADGLTSMAVLAANMNVAGREALMRADTALLRAATAILALSKERDKLRGALEPFAQTTIRDDIPADQAVIGYADIVYLTVADFRRAASSLAAPDPMDV